jgi:hypothetical protein
VSQEGGRAREHARMSCVTNTQDTRDRAQMLLYVILYVVVNIYKLQRNTLYLRIHPTLSKSSSPMSSSSYFPHSSLSSPFSFSDPPIPFCSSSLSPPPPTHHLAPSH